VSAIPPGPSRLAAWPCLSVVAGLAGAPCLLALCTLFLFLRLSWPRGLSRLPSLQSSLGLSGGDPSWCLRLACSSILCRLCLKSSSPPGGPWFYWLVDIYLLSRRGRLALYQIYILALPLASVYIPLLFSVGTYFASGELVP
jgi:hypothetical protein